MAVSPTARRVAAVLLLAYGAAGAVLTLWPTSFVGPLISLIQGIASISFGKAEFLANVALFVPLSALLALVLPARLRYVVLPACFLISVAVESLQAVALPDRVPSVADIVANTAGACIGLVAIAVIDALAGRDPRPPA